MEQDKAIWARATWGECELGNAQRPKRAVALAEGLSHPFSLAYALGCAASFHSLRREGQLAREQVEALITLSTEQGFPYFLAMGTFVRGRALVEQEQVEEGIAQIRVESNRVLAQWPGRSGLLPAALQFVRPATGREQ